MVHIVLSIGEAINNSQKPVQTWPARIVAKRMKVRGGAGNAATSTVYYVTFEQNGDRKEFRVSGEEYGLLVEGDTGILKVQGTWFKGFERNRG